MECENTSAYTTDIKNNYIEGISELLKQCDDISLLDLIQKLLEKSVQHLCQAFKLFAVELIQALHS